MVVTPDMMQTEGAVALAGAAQQMVPVPPLELPDVNEWLVAAGLVLIVMDILLGVAKAVATKTLSSSKMRIGLWHKTAYLGIWAVAWVFNFAVGYADVGFEVPAFDAVSVYVIAMEGLSCVENIAAINPDLKGSRLFGALDGVKEKAGATADKDKKEDENA